MYKDVMNPLRKIYLVMFILLAGLLFVPAVSAENILFETPIEYEDTSVSVVQPANSQSTQYWYDINGIYFKNIELYDNVPYITIDIAGNKHEEGRFEASYTLGSHTGSAVIYVSHATNTFGVVTHTRFVIFPQNWDNSGLINAKTMTFSDFVFYSTTGRNNPVEASFRPSVCVASDGAFISTKLDKATVSVTSVSIWTNQISVNQTDGLYDINLIRNLEGTSYPSTLTIKNNDLIVYTHTGSDDRQVFYPDNSVTDIIINSGVKNYTFSLTSTPGEPPEEPEEPEKGVNKTFSVFIKDGNTYEPIDEANVSFKRYDTGEWLLNKTIYNGYASVTLPTGWYYVYVTSPGYYQPYPVQIVVDENLASSIFRIYPAGESPEPEEPTEFLDLTVSVKNSQTGALIGGSEIGIRRYGDTGFYQNLTLSSGYTTVFLPPGNYEIFAEAQGYYQVYPARITLDQPHENIGVFLQPTTPAPSAGNVTLNVWVCYLEPGSGQAVGIPYADILISGISGDGIGYSSGSLITDMGGYLTLDIPANTEYIAYAEKPGYLAGTTHFTVYNVSPVNMTIQMIREIPPTIPVVTPPPTIPTLPTPTEPLGFMEQSGKALGDLFGVSLSVGKMILGVLISLAVGMGTAKNLKGGAPEFCVGFLGAAFLVTMADLIPVGFFVAMLLLMGIYIARAYFLGGENGG